MPQRVRSETLTSVAASPVGVVVVVACHLFLSAGTLSAQVKRSPEVNAAIERGVAYLGTMLGTRGLGEDSLAALALIKCGVDETNPNVAVRLERVMASVAGATFEPGDEHNGIYSAGIVAMVLGALDRSLYRDQIEKAMRYILEHQNPNGSWNYPSSGLKMGDTSVTQYALLGLWEASMSGIDVPLAAFDKAASWHVQAQDGSTGAYSYRPLGEGDTAPRDTMTAGALGSLMICLRRGPTAKPVLKHRLLIPVIPEGQAAGTASSFVPTTSAADIRRAIARADGYLTNRFNVENPSGISAYYFFYAVERYAALAELEKIGSVDWYQVVSSRMLADQQEDGRWIGPHGVTVNTSFALLFLSRATWSTVQNEEIGQFGGGILIGGRGLPNDFTQVVVEGGGFAVKPLQGSVDQLLGLLKTSSGNELEGARLGLDAALRTGDAAALELGLARLEELAEHPVAHTRQIAVWALARLERLEVVPLLIHALDDPDEGVREQARHGLRVLRRRFGDGAADSSRGEASRSAPIDWKAWYRALNPKWQWSEP